MITIGRTKPSGDPTKPSSGDKPSSGERRSRRARGRPLVGLIVASAVAVLASSCAAPSAETAPAPPVPDPSTATALTKEDVDAWLDGMLPTALEQSSIAGATVSVVHDGELLTSRGYGYSDTGTGSGKPQRVDPDETMFRIGSVSKLFTATAVMQLVEAGKLDLDTDVSEYLDFPLNRSFEADITLRHLLTHTAGFEERIRGMMKPQGAQTNLREHLISNMPEQVYEPGTTPGYSNFSNSLAGYIVQRTSGMPFAQYVEENIFEPLGMESSSFEQPLPKEVESQLSKGFVTDDGPAQPYKTITDAPAGAMASTAPDMARFMLAHLGDVGSGQTPILQPEMLELMHTPALDSDTLGNLANGPRMAIGFFGDNRNGQRIIGHGGDTMHFHTRLQIYPEQGTGIFISLNSSGEGTASLDIREALMTGFTDRYFPGKPSDTSVEPTAQEHAEMAEGTYVTSRSMHSTFLSAISLQGQTKVTAREDGTIRVSPAPVTGRTLAYEEIKPWVWREVGGQRILTMRVEDGRVQAIGAESAFSFLRAGPLRQTSVVLPILIASLAVLVLTVLSWPIGAVIRRRRSLPKRDPAGRWARVLTKVGVAAAVVAAIGWFTVIMMVMGMQVVPQAVLILLIGIQIVAALAIIPAVVALVNDIRRRAGWKRYAGGALVLTALLGVNWFANAFNLMVPNLTY